MFDLECISMPKGERTEKVASFAYASGLAAVTSILLAHSTPLTILLPDDLYHGVSSLLLDVFSKHGVSVKHVNMRQVHDVEAAVVATDPSDQVIVWMESPSNPKCHVLDICSICHAMETLRSSHVITTIVDGTMATPVLTRPLEVRNNVRQRAVIVFV